MQRQAGREAAQGCRQAGEESARLASGSTHHSAVAAAVCQMATHVNTRLRRPRRSSINLPGVVTTDSLQPGWLRKGARLDAASSQREPRTELCKLLRPRWARTTQG